MSYALTLKPSQDVMIIRAEPNTNFASSGLLSLNYDDRRIFIQFDLSPLAGKRILGAKLRFYVASTGNVLPNARRVVSAWNQSTITWNNRPSIEPDALHTGAPQKWDAAGFREMDLKITELIKLINTNHGISVIAHSSSSSTVTAYSTRHANSAYHAQLVVTIKEAAQALII